MAVAECGSGGTGRHTILRGWRRKAWGFKSPLPHHELLLVEIDPIAAVSKPRRSAFRNYDLLRDSHSYFSVLLHHRGGVAAKRQEWRHLGRIRRTRQPDCVRSAGRSQRAVKSYHVVGRGIHGHVNYTLGLCLQTGWPGLGLTGSQITARKDTAGAGPEACSSAHAKVSCSWTTSWGRGCANSPVPNTSPFPNWQMRSQRRQRRVLP